MYPPPPAIIIFFVTGMHRKSMEATQSLGHDLLSQQRGYDKEDEEGSGSSSEDEEPERKPKIDEKDDFRSSSIAALRAKAQAGVNILLNIRKKKRFSFFSKIHPLHNIDPWAPGALGQDVRQQLWRSRSPEREDIRGWRDERWRRQRERRALPGRRGPAPPAVRVLSRIIRGILFLIK